MTTKAQLLAHYAEKPVTEFRQYDGFLMLDGGDDVMKPDEDGHCHMAGYTKELMSGVAAVRVLVNESRVQAADAAAMLRKIADWIERDEPFLPETRERPDEGRHALFDAAQILDERYNLRRAQEHNDTVF